MGDMPTKHIFAELREFFSRAETAVALACAPLVEVIYFPVQFPYLAMEQIVG
jgi:hypothetical protein